MNITQQTTRNAKTWRDETGQEIPFNRITPLERKKEKYAFKIAGEAAKIQDALTSFKALVGGLSLEIFQEVLSQKELSKATKGNFTWYNFDMSIKIEVSIDERITFDSLLIEKCKALLLDMVEEGLQKDKAFLKELVLGAFQTSRGKLDTKKVLSLKKYASRITDKRYHQAMGYLEESIRRPDSKKYFRVWVRDEAGSYQHIELNFSAI